MSLLISETNNISSNIKSKTVTKKASDNNKSVSKKDRKVLLQATLTALGIAGAAAIAIYKTKSIINTKKAIQQAAKLSEERKAAAEILRKAKEEEIRQAETVAQQKLKQQTEQRAREDAGFEIRKEAEVPQKDSKTSVQITAQKAAEQKLHKETISELNNLSALHSMQELNVNIPVDEISNNIVRLYFTHNKELNQTSGITTDIINIIKTAESKGDSVTIDELKKVLSDCMTPVDILKDKIKTIKDDRCTISTIGEFLNIIDNKNTYIKNILNMMDEMPKAEGEKTSEYLQKVISAHINKAQKEEAAFEELIKSKLHYADDLPENKIQLTPAEKQELIDKLNECTGLNLSADTPLYKLSDIWKNKYISGMTPDLSQSAETAILSNFPKASADAYYLKAPYTPYIAANYRHKPLCRWMQINNIDDFLRQFADEGCEYSYNRLQSCSVNYHFGEIKSFNDWTSKYNVKFIIHPKTSTHRAVEMGEGKYGNTEAIYPAGEKFKYLGKIKREVAKDSLAGVNETFYRWEIHLQEM